MAIEFYYFYLSPPSRAVWMVLEEMGLKYNKNVVDIMTGKHKTEEYKKINPRQKVPALKDGDFCMAESRAIAQYLANKYGAQQNQQSLYPTDPKKRATVDQHLYISENTVEQIVSYVNMPGVLFRGEDKKEENFDKAKAAVQAVEDSLTCSKFTAGNDFTLADIFYYMALAFLDVADFDWSGYPKVMEWRKAIAAKSWFKEVWADNHAKLVEMYNAKRGGAKKA